MTEKETRSGQAADLRKRAENIVREKTIRMPETMETLSPEETRQTLHELRVHQVELETQNEELRRAQMELEAARTRYFDLYDLAPVAYLTVSEKGLILEANLTAANMLGVARGELPKQPFSRFIVSEDRGIYYMHRKQLFDTGAPQVCEMRMVKNNYASFWARMEATAASDIDGSSVCRAVMIDIAERRRAEEDLQLAHDELEQRVDERTEELMQANEGLRTEITERKRVENDLMETVQQLQETMDMLVQFGKEAAIGRIAAGVSHEILNPAGIISSQLQFLEKESLSEPAMRNVRVSREQLQKIVKISHDLHQSSPKKPGTLVRGDLRHVVEAGLQMTERRREEDRVRIEYDPPSKPIVVKMAMNKLVKVLVHLILNACDAMTVNEEKRLIVSIQYHEVSSQCLSVHLTVADNGHGIPAGYLNRIFDPFFTTKDPGKGTGLGLSICRSIILEHGGAIRAENNAMGGASFIVELPL